MSNKIELIEEIINVLIHNAGKEILEEIEVEQICENAKQMTAIQGNKYAKEEFNNIIRTAKSKYCVKAQEGIVIKAEQEHKTWYPMGKAETEGFFWKRYKRYLETNLGFARNVVTIMDKTTDEIMDLLGDPNNKEPFKRRGLILGDVQSGKTANYISICNKAADAGYKVIILLTGTIESLRKQTQGRIDDGFLGRKSTEVLQKRIKTVYVGVGKINHEKNANTFTSEIKDFSNNFLVNMGLSLKGVSSPTIFVVKKNKKILNNLIEWLYNHNREDDSDKIELPMLLIDDEADNASINTKEENNPTAINEKIRSLLKLFTKTTYIGVTATPFANIFIDPETETQLQGDELFPKDFIYLVQPPSNYIGCNDIFGEEPIYSKNLTLIEDAENYFKIGHNQDIEIEELPKSLKDAIYYYILTNVVRDLRGDTIKHRTMLINISRYNKVQEMLAQKIEEWMTEVITAIDDYSKLEEEETSKITIFTELKAIWDTFNFTKFTKKTWKYIQQNCLIKATKPIEIRKVNQNTKTALNYEAYKEIGARFIVIGGNSLSRGITLEGLVVSYFYRNTQAYDTLLQMGRWFGYRKNYEDIFRIWMHQDAIDWFGSVNEAVQELKGQVVEMRNLGLTPYDFALKVRKNPEALMITAKNKMRYTGTIRRRISISGRLIETPRISAKKEDLQQNYEEIIQIFKKLKQEYIEEEEKGAKIFRNITAKVIIEILTKIKTHPYNIIFNKEALINYINSNKLNLWDIAIPQGKGEKDENPYIEIYKELRKFSKREDMLMVNGTKLRIGSKGSTNLGITQQQIEDIEEKYNRRADAKENIPDNEYLIRNRKPLLLIHLLQPNNTEEIEQKIPIVGLAMGLPKKEDDEEKLVEYVVNTYFLKNGYLEEEDEIEQYYAN